MSVSGPRCDLCGGREWQPVIELRHQRVMISDRRIVTGDLVKQRCTACGLVSSTDLSGSPADQMYSAEYVQGFDDDHVFHGHEGPSHRSHVFADWVSTGREHVWRTAVRIVEIGAGNGTLLRELATRFPEATFTGLDLNAAAVANARTHGLDVVSAWSSLPRQVDLIYAIAVLEHVPSPAAFIRHLRELLVPGGMLVLAQPTQDVPSYDVMFVDHLHHFGSRHLAAYAHATGFVEVEAVVGHPLMPNFSLHVWRREEGIREPSWRAPSVETHCAESARRFQRDVAAINRLLDRLHADARIAVFGLSEVYALFRAYSQLGDVVPLCGLADTPPDRSLGALPFPVVAPERTGEFGVTDVLLTMNRLYYPRARARLAPYGVRVHEILSA